MIEQIDDQIQQWITSIVPSVNVSLLPPSQTTRGITLYLMSLASAPPPRTARRPPLQVLLRYLVLVQDDKPDVAHQRLGALIFAALASPEFVVDLTPLPAETWQSWGMGPQPSFILDRVARLEQPEPVAPLVRQVVVRTTPLTTLSGVVTLPDKMPVPRARVELPDLQAVTYTDRSGRFMFTAVPGDPAPRQVRVTVKNRTMDFAIDSDPTIPKNLIFQFG
jgi:hypothetical protein